MKFYGKIGYVGTVEVTPGRYEERVVREAPAYGDVKTYRRHMQSTDQQNDNVELGNEIRIILDPYAQEHFHEIRYVLWQGVRWEAKTVTLEWPRLRISMGGVYHGPTYTGGA